MGRRIQLLLELRYLVQFGVAIRMRCGLDIAHLQLSETLHAADRGRDTANWSAVGRYKHRAQVQVE